MNLEELPMLTEVSGDQAELPVLTSVVAAQPPVVEAPPPVDLSATGAHMRPLNPAEVDQLLRQLESHLETVFSQKLNSQLEQLQKLAVELAISEFKAELPSLIIDALKNSDASR
jgi:hypothetical protein